MSTPLYDKFLLSRKYSDELSRNKTWIYEVEKWFSAIDISYLEKNKGRFAGIGREKQRNNFLAELCVNYYLSKILDWKLEQISPLGKNKHELEYIFTDNTNKMWHCEVKNSSWEAEIMSRDISDEIKLRRIHEAKYKNGDGGSFSLDASYIDVISKAEKQFDPLKNNLLIIVPDTFIGPFVDPFLEENVRSATSFNSPINRVAFLTYENDNKQIVYRWKLFEIDN